MTRIKKDDKKPRTATERGAARLISLRVLILEDSASDAELVLADLRRAGFEPDWQRVETEADYLAALEQGGRDVRPYDLILADYHLPQFDGQRALHLLKERGLEIPFILVSGAVGEETAVKMMKEGAADYVLKDRMARLGQAVVHVLEDRQLQNEKRQAEEALRENEERFRKLAETTSTAIFVYQGENISYVNEACEKISGYSKDELLSMKFWELIHPDSRETIRQRGLERQRGEPLPSQYEVRLVRKDGSERWLDYTAGPISWGGQSAVVGTATDITERKRAEEDLRESEARYRTLAEASQDMIFIITRQGFIDYVNQFAARQFGCKPEELLGKRPADIFPPEVFEHQQKNLRRVFQSGEPVYAEELTTFGKRDIWLGTWLVPLEAANGEIKSMMGVSRDITERKQAEEQIRQRNEDLALINAINAAANRGESLETIIRLISEENMRVFGGLGTVLYLLNENRDRLVMQNLGLPSKMVDQIEKVIGLSIPSIEHDLRSAALFRQVLEGKQGRLITDPAWLQEFVGSYVSSTPLSDKKRARIEKLIPTLIKLLGLKSLAIVPLVSGNEAVGALEMGSNDILTEDDLHHFESLAGQLTAAIQRKQAEEALRQSEKKYRNLYENVPDGVYRTTSGGDILEANPAIARMFGYASEEEFKQATNARDLYVQPAVRDEFLRAVEKSGGILRQEIVLKRRDGTPLTLLDNMRAVRDSEGKTLYYEGVLTDITERKQAEEELRKLWRAVESSPDSIVITDTAAKIEYVNPAFVQITGYTREEAIGGNPRILKSGETPPEEYARLWDTIAHGGVWRGEFHNKKKNGELYWESASIAPVLDAHGAITHYVAVKEDITERKRAEEALQQRTEELERFFSVNLDLLCIADTDGYFRKLNAAWETTLGYTQEELKARRFLDFIHPDDIPATLDVIETLKSQKEVIDFVNRYRCKDGTYRWIEWRATPADNLIYAAARDITKRKQMEESLRESEQRYQTLAEVSPVGIFRTDPQGQTTYVNPRWCEISGLAAAEALGDGWLAAVHPEDREGLAAGWRQAAQDQTASFSEYRFIRPDGAVAWVMGQAIPEKDSDGNVVSYIGTITDITERKQAEEKLQENERRFRALVENGSDEISILTVGGALLYESPSANPTLGYRYGEFLEQNLFQLVHPDDLERIQTAFAGLVQDANQHPREQFRLRHHDGRWIWIEAVGTNLLAEPSVRGIVINYHDITERKQAEQELQRLYGEARQHALEMETLNRIGQRLTATLSREEIVEQLGLEAGDLLRAGNFSVILRDEAREEFEVKFYLDRGERKEGASLSLAQGLTGLILSRKEPILADDYLSECRKRGVKPPGVGPAAKAWLGVPMIAQDKTLGALLVWDYEQEGSFSTWDMRILSTLAAQAAIAFENARLLEAEHRRRIEAETLRDAAAALTTSLELDQVLDNLFDALAKVVPYNSAVVFLHEGDLLRAAAGRGFEKPEKVIGQGMPADNPLYQEIRKSRQVLLIPDVQSDPRFSRWGDSDRVHGWLGAPLIVHGQVIGQLSIDHLLPAVYNETHAELALALANQAAVAIQNARLYGELQAALTTQAELFEASTNISSQSDLDTMLKNIAESAREAALADQTSVMLIDEQGYCHHWIGIGYTGSKPPHQVRPEGISLRVTRSRQAAFIPNFHTAPEANPLMHGEGVHSAACLPLIGKTGVSGVMWVNFFAAHDFSPAEQTTLQIFANHAAVAVEQARLFEETRKRLADLEAVNRISTALRGAQSIEEMLPRLIDETLSMIGTSAGVLWLHDAANACLKPAIARGWFAQIKEPSIALEEEGIAGHVFASGEAHISPEFVHDALTKKGILLQIPGGWGGACVPIRSEQETIGVLFVSVQLPRQLDEEEIHLLTTISEIAGNAIRRAGLLEETKRQLQRLATLHAIDMAINSVLDLRVLLNILLDHIITQLKVDAASVLLLDKPTLTLEFAAGRGYREEAAARSNLFLGEGFAGRAALERVLVHAPNLAEGDTERCKQLRQEGFVDYYALPLIAKGEVKGVLEICHRLPLDADAEWLSFLETLAGQTAIAVDNASLFDNLQRSNLDLALAYDATIEGWSRALDLRDKETEGHTQRVTELTLKLARAMGLGEEELLHIRRGALLHDIGKMGVPDSILLKPDKLSDEEWNVMRKHPALAYEMLYPIEYLRPALDIPYCHHEKWDGTGYPRGLRGVQIPLSARIFAIVDVYDALISDRPYRKAWPREDSLAYLNEQAGKHFDPAVVEAFMKFILEA